MPRPAPSSVIPTLLLSCVPLLGACGADGEDAPAATRVDSAGREIVTSSAPAWRDGEGWTVRADPVLTIGVVEGEDAYQLFRVSDVLRLGDGRIVVANAGTREVRIFDGEGRYVATVGGPGQGPSEFGYPTGLMPGTDGGFVVIDRMDLVRFDADGGFTGRETFDRQRWAEIAGALGPSEGGTLLGDGRVLAPIYGRGFSGDVPPPGPPYRPEITMVLVEPSSGVVDTLAHIGGIRQQFIDVGGPRAIPIVGPFAPSGRWFRGRDGTVVVYDGEPAQVEVVTPEGRHRILRWAAEPEPVTPAEIEAWKDRQRNASWAQSQLPQLERGWAEMDPPTVKAMVTDARPGRDGSTWVRTSPSMYEGVDRARWEVFGRDGAWLGALELPGGFTPYEIGDDYLLGVERDPETEIETVLMLGLEKSGR